MWPVIGAGGVALGAGGYLGYQAWMNRLPSWLSDQSIEQFLTTEGVPAESISGDASAIGVSELGGEFSGLLETEGLEDLLFLAAL